LGVGRQQRQGNGEAAALVEAVADRPNLPLVLLYQVVHDRQTQTQTSLGTGGAAVGLAKSIKDVG